MGKKQEMTIQRRRLLQAGAIVLPIAWRIKVAISRSIQETLEDAHEWSFFKKRHLSTDGRIVDGNNGGISHSEGQAYTLFMAAYMDDRPTFDKILVWTKENLQKRRTDTLLSWRFRPGAMNPVEDRNNATDADLFFASALGLAGERWGSTYTDMSKQIAQDILKFLLVRSGMHQVLLPGVEGFQHQDKLMLNPSYHTPVALKILSRVYPDPAWRRIDAGEKEVLDMCRFGPYGLPSDWIQISTSGGVPIPHPQKPPLFGYDAIRVPLHAAWSGEGGTFKALDACTTMWRLPKMSPMPSTVNVITGDRGKDDASPGMLGIAKFSFSTLSKNHFILSKVEDSYDYYSAALTMLTRMAARDNNIAIVMK